MNTKTVTVAIGNYIPGMPYRDGTFRAVSQPFMERGTLVRTVTYVCDGPLGLVVHNENVPACTQVRV